MDGREISEKGPYRGRSFLHIGYWSKTQLYCILQINSVYNIDVYATICLPTDMSEIRHEKT